MRKLCLFLVVLIFLSSFTLAQGGYSFKEKSEDVLGQVVSTSKFVGAIIALFGVKQGMTFKEAFSVVAVWLLISIIILSILDISPPLKFGYVFAGSIFFTILLALFGLTRLLSRGMLFVFGIFIDHSFWQLVCFVIFIILVMWLFYFACKSIKKKMRSSEMGVGAVT
jgi:hypothetical protein